MQLIGEADLCPEPSGTSSEVFAGGTSIVRNTRRLKIGRALRLKKPNLRTWFVWRAWKSVVLGDRSSSPRSDTLISVCARGGCPSGLFNSHENIHGTCWSLFFALTWAQKCESITLRISAQVRSMIWRCVRFGLIYKHDFGWLSTRSNSPELMLVMQPVAGCRFW
jgi:hypothetical protein